jgi:hypothetical protein
MPNGYTESRAAVEKICAPRWAHYKEGKPKQVAPCPGCPLFAACIAPRVNAGIESYNAWIEGRNIAAERLAQEDHHV